MDKKYLKDLFVRFEQSQNEKDKSHFDFFKSISTLSVALIGLLIGLKASPIPNPEAKVSFLITIILIGLCVLFSLASRFYEVASRNNEVEIRREMILNYVSNPEENDLQIEQIKKPRIYKFFEICTYVCLSLSIIALIAYVFFLDFC